jgi:hypothetical protein
MFPVADKVMDWATIVPSSADLVILYFTVELIDGLRMSTVTTKLSVFLVYFKSMVTTLVELVLNVATKLGSLPVTVDVFEVQVLAIVYPPFI